MKKLLNLFEASLRNSTGVGTICIMPAQIKNWRLQTVTAGTSDQFTVQPRCSNDLVGGVKQEAAEGVVVAAVITKEAADGQVDRHPVTGLQVHR